MNQRIRDFSPSPIRINSSRQASSQSDLRGSDSFGDPRSERQLSKVSESYDWMNTHFFALERFEFDF